MNENRQNGNGLAWAGPVLFAAVAVALALLFWWFLSA
jgi:hypothetical protein